MFLQGQKSYSRTCTLDGQNPPSAPGFQVSENPRIQDHDMDSALETVCFSVQCQLSPNIQSQEVCLGKSRGGQGLRTVTSCVPPVPTEAAVSAPGLALHTFLFPAAGVSSLPSFPTHCPYLVHLSFQ